MSYCKAFLCPHLFNILINNDRSYRRRVYEKWVSQSWERMMILNGRIRIQTVFHQTEKWSKLTMWNARGCNMLHFRLKNGCTRSKKDLELYSTASIWERKPPTSQQTQWKSTGWHSHQKCWFISGCIHICLVSEARTVFCTMQYQRNEPWRSYCLSCSQTRVCRSSCQDGNV